MGPGLLGKLPPINFPYFIPQALRDPSDIRTSCNSVVDFLLQAFNLRFRGTGLIGTVEVMISAVMMDGVTPQVSIAVNKPSTAAAGNHIQFAF